MKGQVGLAPAWWAGCSGKLSHDEAFKGSCLYPQEVMLAWGWSGLANASVHPWGCCAGFRGVWSFSVGVRAEQSPCAWLTLQVLNGLGYLHAWGGVFFGVALFPFLCLNPARRNTESTPGCV